MDKKCFADDGQNTCRILLSKNCDGCKFYRTKSDYVAAYNSSVLKCREKGLCNGCKYRNADKGRQCELMTETV